MKPTNFPLMELLYKALHTPFGIVIETNNAERLRQKLYPLRKEDPDLTCLAFVISPLNGSDLWIVKQGQPNEE